MPISNMFKTALAAAGVVLAGGVAAHAQTAPAGESPVLEQPGEAAAFTEEKLEAFVVAALEVSEVQERYVASIGQADSEEQQQELASQANIEMTQAIEQSPGITLDEYIEIGEAAQVDPALNQRITALVEQHQQIQ